MKELLTRRKLAGRLGRALILAGAPLGGACKSTPAPSGAQSTGKREGLIEVTRGQADLDVPTTTTEGEVWRYGLTFPFQVSPEQGAVFCNIRKVAGLGADHEVGTDVIIFDDLSRVRAENAVPVSRNEEAGNPKTTPPGAHSLMVKYPVRGGFVPLGAKRADGSAHPHAGTGFGICRVVAWPLEKEHLVDIPDRTGTRPYRGEDRYEYFELAQYAYDGATFRVVKKEDISETDLLPGVTLFNPGLTSAIPDGDDLLFTMSGGTVDPASLHPDECRRRRLAFDRHDPGSGVLRWRRNASGWHPVSFVAATAEDNSIEPSLIRDTDGSLLLSARGGRESTYNDAQVWRSQDGGETWSEVIRVRGLVGSTPISINQAADGTPYIAGNLFQALVHPMAARYKLPPDPAYLHIRYMHHEPEEHNITVRGGGWQRETLYLWPLNRDRTGLAPPLVARLCREEFGPPPGESTWNIDHPAATTLRLSDGGWHNVLGARVVERAEITHGSDATPQTGGYLEEVVSGGTPIPIWRF